MKTRKSAKVIPICMRSQNMVRNDQEELGQPEVLSDQKRLCQLVEDFINYLKRDQGPGSLGAISPASIRHHQVALAGFLLWMQSNVPESD